ncbi:hypothetical protein, partial [Weissella minor]|uniref:hypothetical protein n=1 Tax=Weissella minor TaxID=1620 RepID=UPI000B0C7F59
TIRGYSDRDYYWMHGKMPSPYIYIKEKGFISQDSKGYIRLQGQLTAPEIANAARKMWYHTDTKKESNS